ncbi:hypothetical protein BC936DRAFT_147335 [Jimgerdemannia flammicorona]|uniref:Uncharacterized protein n=2 Tax=Jimgerdemannia flammicorona TaxID=994334 RepID=A0A433Q8B7_9FUNG|nr:hypothetical protein BC936DRAFT_147335 [Jimgerdemannia flammicorona]RUS26027.1 hypothetical protein BC938DRAFT_471316 [Jimgerdemannia flammicorona]
MLLASKISLRTLPLRLPILSARLPTLPVRLPTLPVRLPTLPTRLPTPSVYRCYRPVFPPQYPQHQYQPYYQNQRFWIVVGTAGGLAGAYYVTHLETVPISGRRRFLDVTPQQEEGIVCFDMF